MEDYNKKFFEEVDYLIKKAGEDKNQISLMVEFLELSKAPRVEFVQKCDDLLIHLKAKKQILADAHAYDVANGQEEIDVNKIPF